MSWEMSSYYNTEIRGAAISETVIRDRINCDIPIINIKF